MHHFEPEPITIPPTLSGNDARAWLIDTKRYVRALEKAKQPSAHAVVAQWIVEAPWAHPHWHSYLISGFHLRVVDGLPAPIIRKLGATHEINVFALDPEKGREVVIRGAAPPLSIILTPANYVGQFIMSDPAADELSAHVVRRTVIEILDGALSPDTDYRHQWVNRFGDEMLA